MLKPNLFFSEWLKAYQSLQNKKKKEEIAEKHFVIEFVIEFLRFVLIEN